MLNWEFVVMYFIVFLKIIKSEVNVYLEGKGCFWNIVLVMVISNGVVEWNMMNVLMFVCLRRFVLVKMVR